MDLMIIDVVKVILPAVLTFLVGIGITPYITDFLYKHEMWKKKAGKTDTAGNDAPVFNKLHAHKEVGTPRMGGIVVWASTFIVLSAIWLLAYFSPLEIFAKLDFLSRNQTWIPLAALMIGAFVGLLDDYLEIKGSRDNVAGGLSSKKRLAVVALIGIFVSCWFLFKLDVNAINIPFYGALEIGWLLIPFFTAVMIVIYAGGVIDGLDGLSGGVFTIMFAAYSVIAFSLGQVNLAAFCAALVGSILAFLWFNIPPARFYLSETGSMALTIVLSIVALMTDNLGGGVGLFVLPIIAFPLIATAGSSFIQIWSKKLFNGKKPFLSAPLHHHFEAIGWPAYKVVMRYWILSAFFASVGIIFALIV
jgi:phospho-N-acetylmuramoyl-pentapeptide-transferase